MVKAALTSQRTASCGAEKIAPGKADQQRRHQHARSRLGGNSDGMQAGTVARRIEYAGSNGGNGATGMQSREAFHEIGHREQHEPQKEIGRIFGEPAKIEQYCQARVFQPGCGHNQSWQQHAGNHHDRQQQRRLLGHPSPKALDMPPPLLQSSAVTRDISNSTIRNHRCAVQW